MANTLVRERSAYGDSVDASLRDGTPVLIRPIRPDDKALLADGLRRLSPESVYRRFLSPKPSFSKGELRYLTELDGRDHVALVAFLAEDPSQLAGVARFVRSDDDHETAEAAVVVGDACQGRGLGNLLALRLADEAAARGIRRFEATILWDNVPAHRLMAAIAYRFKLSAQLPEAA